MPSKLPTSEVPGMITDLSITPGVRKGVVLADDHDLVRAGIQGLIELLPDVEVVAQAGSGEELLVVLDRVKPHLVITDIHMPGMDGVETVAKVRARHPGLAILVLSMFDSAETVQRAVAAGANGYLMKNAAPEELQHAVSVVLSTGSYVSARRTAPGRRAAARGPAGRGSILLASLFLLRRVPAMHGPAPLSLYGRTGAARLLVLAFSPRRTGSRHAPAGGRGSRAAPAPGKRDQAAHS